MINTVCARWRTSDLRDNKSRSQYSSPWSALRIGAAASQITMDNANRRRNLGFFFDASVARLPDKVAIIDLFGGSERLATYRRLDARMNAVASMLARLGVAPGERLAMLIGNRTEFIEFFFGAMRAGAIPLPLNTRLAADTLEQIIAQAACTLAIVDPSSHGNALAIARRSPLRHRLILDRRDEDFLSFEEEMTKPAAPVDPPAIADGAQRRCGATWQSRRGRARDRAQAGRRG